MDLADLYGDMDLEESDELGASFSASGRLSLPSLSGRVSTGASARGRTIGGRTYRVGAKLPSGYYWTKSGTIGRKTPVKKKKKKKVTRASSGRTAILRGMMKAKPKRKVKRYTPRRLTMRRPSASAIMRLKSPMSRGVIGPMRRTLPISKTAPAAYRHLACNAGVGGEAGLALLKQIKALVQLTNTRMLATSEHHNINNTQAFRRAVLRGLTAKRRACR